MAHHGHIQIYLHFVWATYRRMALVTSDLEPAVHACIVGEAKRAECEVLVIGGMPDHLHLAVRLPTTLAPAELARRAKGVSSTMVRKTLRPGEFFGWQDGYGVFSFSHSHRERVVAYIRNQKRHHARQSIWAPWEETPDEEP
jgi:putative transposase